jgi:hypothetical protein
MDFFFEPASNMTPDTSHVVSTAIRLMEPIQRVPYVVHYGSLCVPEPTMSACF